MNKRISNILFLFIFLFSNFLYCQSILVWSENKEEASKVSAAIKDGKSLLVFNTKLELTFESSIEKLEEITKKDDLYSLQVTSGAQVITFKNNGNEYSINFGQLMDDNTLPSLKEKEIKYFTITEKKQLEYYNITENERSKGNIGVPIGPNVSDALIIVKLSPTDLNLEIKDVNNIISKIEKDNDTYKIFIKTNDSEYKRNLSLNLFESEYGDTEMPIYGIMSKEMRYYLVKKDNNPKIIQPLPTNKIPQNAILYFNKGVLKFDLKDYNGAILDFKKAIDIAVKYEDAYFNIGKCFSMLKDFNESKKYFKKVIDLNPKSGLGYIYYGKVMSELGQYDEVLINSNIAIVLDNKSSDAYDLRAQGKCYKNDYESALLDSNIAIGLDKNNCYLYHNRAVIKNGLNDFKGAIQDYSKSIEINPSNINLLNADSYYWRGTMKYRLNDLNGAIEDFTKSIEVDPNNVNKLNADAFYWRGTMKYNLKDYNGSIQDFNKVISFGTDKKKYAYYWNGSSKYNLKDYNGAIQDYSKSIEIDPTEKYSYYYRGLSKINLNNKEGGCSDIKKAQQLDSSIVDINILNYCK